jgi:sugar/nucleoside kinase (ribokinase family)
MKNLFVCGKKYLDTILIAESVIHGETNKCSSIIKKNGGLYNFFEIEYKNWKIKPVVCGEKEAFIVSNKSKSTRTSFVNDITPSKFSKRQLSDISKTCDWLHISYIDDFDCWQSIIDLNLSYSLDFCTDKPRERFIQLLKKAKVIFDSRERRILYENITIKTPIVLHDENGFEIIINGKTIHNEVNVPTNGLNVNGAGDIFAGLFIEKYFDLGLVESSKFAMQETTKILKNRK